MAPTKTPSTLPAVQQFAANVGKDLAYDALMPAFYDAGFQLLLDETDATGMVDASVLIRFDVLIGREGGYEKFTKLSIKVPNGPGYVSAVARRMAYETLPYLIFNRAPPAGTPAPAPGQMNGGDEHVVAMDDGDVVLVDEPGEASTVRVVERREPDGLPIFRDLYEIGPGEANSTGEIISAVLDEARTFLETASVEQVDALALKNPELVTFVKDLGTPADSAELRSLVTARKTTLTARPEPAARRRVSALQRAN